MYPITRHLCRQLGAAWLLLLASASQGFEPVSVNIGPVALEPVLDTRLFHTDNVLRSHDDTLDSWVLAVEPELRAWLTRGASHYAVGYQLTDLTYASSHSDDVTDHRVILDLHHEFNARHTLEIDGQYFDGHERRGTGLSEGEAVELFDKPIAYQRKFLGGLYTLGNLAGPTRLELGYRLDDYEYQNFRDYTRGHDRTLDRFRGTAFYRIAPRTDVLVELRHIGSEYDEKYPGIAAYDSDEWSYLVGLDWAATARTSGSVKVGAYEREFDDRRRNTEDGFRWEAELAWQPRSYSVLELGTRQYSQETDGVGDFVQTREYQLDWNHAWSGLTKTDIGLLVANDNYAGFEREDDRVELEARIGRSLDRWLDMGLGYRYEKRDSDDRGFDYSRNVVFFDLRLSL